ncbi:MAG: MlaD family protein [Gemmataceae bacterium]
MSTRGMRARLGLFVVLAGVLFASLIVMFNSLPTLFRRTSTYTVRFTDAPGLAPGAPVRRSGVRIGEVRNITLDEVNGIVRVKLAINAPYTIRKNDQPTLMTGLLGSDTSLDFLPRQVDDGEPVDRDPVPPGAELVGFRAATVNTLLKGASEVVPSTQETLSEIRKSIARIEKLAARVEQSVPLAEETIRAYRDLARRSQASIPQLEKTNSDMQELIRAARGVVPDVQATVDQYRQLGKSINDAVPELNRTNREIAEFTRQANNALPSFTGAAEKVGDLAADLTKLRPRIEGTLDDFAAAARRGEKLLEEFDVFWQGNRDKVGDTLTNLQRGSGQILKLVTDENVNKVNGTLTNLRTASDSFPQVSRNAADISEQGRTTVRRLNDLLAKLDQPLTDLPKVMADIQRFTVTANLAISDVQRVTRPLGDRSESITRNVDESVQKLNATLGDVRALMMTIDRADGLLKKVLTDPSLYNNLDAAAVMVLKMVPRVDRILKDFETFADKVARHPEVLGVGGAVRPGSGLKNPPTPPLNAGPPQEPPGGPVPVTHTPFSPRR